MDTSMAELMTKIGDLVSTIYPYLLIAVALVVLVWGVYIGVRIAIAHKNEEQVNARGMVKNLIIGVLVIFIIMVAVPLLISGLSAWAGVDFDLSTYFTFS